MTKSLVIIFTDGACSGNPGPGGWGAIIAFGDRVRELGGSASGTTNNRMELTATIEALRFVYDTGFSEGEIHLHTDSTYIIRGITGWVFGWMKRGWITAQGGAVENKDLWEILLKLTRRPGVKIDWRYVRGHSGTPGNERCDEIAVSFSKDTGIVLYSGSLRSYPTDLQQVPEDMSLPEMKKPGEEKAKGPATYLSYVNGALQRDKDWKSCEARVKGVPGAKFKKVTSSAEEAAILKKWGVKD